MKNMITNIEIHIKKKFFLYGGTFIAKLAPYINEKLGDVCGTIIGPSPLSWKALISRDSACSWLEEMDKALCELKPDYFIFDLQRVTSILFEENGDLISPLKVVKPNETIPEKFHLIDPLLLSKKQRNMFLDQFISVVKKHFDSDHMILLQTTYPRYYVKNDHLQDYSKIKHLVVNKKNIDIINECEEYIVKNKHCQFIDIQKFYFGKKEVGKKLTNVIFESYCYEDIVGKINDIILKKVPNNRPSFLFSLIRRNKYRNSFYQKGFQTFLNHDYFLDHLVDSAAGGGGEFISRYFDDLLLLDKLDWTDVDTALAQTHSLDIKPELYDILYTFSEIRKGNCHSVSEESYAHLFREKIVTSELITELTNNQEKLNIIKRQIKTSNAGYYFALLNGYDVNKFIFSDTNICPQKIDIFGSCISRFSFTLNDMDFAVDGYWFHVLPLKIQDRKADYPPEVFGEKLNWTEKLAKIQLDDDLLEDIMKSSGEWLLIDFFSFITSYQYEFKGQIFTNYQGDVAKKLHAKKINIFELYTFEELMEMAEPYFDLVQKKYGNKIILLNATLTSFWIGDDLVLRSENKEYPANQILEKTYDYFSNRLKCYTVSINPLFIMDNTAFFNQAAIHKEDVCYHITYDVIRYITSNMPKEKHYDHIPGSIWTDRILRLIKTNSLYAMEQVFNATFFDRIVIRMDYRIISKYRKYIAEIYDLKFSDYDSMMCGYKFEECPELKDTIVQIATDVKPADAEKIPSSYSGYKDEEEVFDDISSDYDPPVILSPANLRCEKSNENVHLSWEMSENADGYILRYRFSKNDKWINLKNLPQNVLSFDHLINSDDIYYCIKAYRKVGIYKQYSKGAVYHYTAEK